MVWLVVSTIGRSYYEIVTLNSIEWARLCSVWARFDVSRMLKNHFYDYYTCLADTGARAMTISAPWSEDGGTLIASQGSTTKDGLVGSEDEHGRIYEQNHDQSNPTAHQGALLCSQLCKSKQALVTGLLQPVVFTENVRRSVWSDGSVLNQHHSSLSSCPSVSPHVETMRRARKNKTRTSYYVFVRTWEDYFHSERRSSS